jgi:pyruvate formate lyase activating enzyme
MPLHMGIENACIFHIARGSLHDGPGLRTVVYVKGCSLACLWCQNPESIQPGRQIAFVPSRCIGCGRCGLVCPAGCHVVENGVHEFLRGSCTKCATCCDACPAEALSSIGKEMGVEEVFREVEKDRHFFDATHGGMTLSGGECLLRPAFCRELLQRCRDEGIHTAVESALHVPRRNIEQVIDKVDTMIVDLKHCDSAVHRRLTGAGNHRILANLAYVASVHDDIWLRVPLIPGYNDDPENLKETAAIVERLGGGIRRIELLRYNDLTESKYRMLGLAPETVGLRPQTDGDLEEATRIVAAALRRSVEVLHS